MMQSFALQGVLRLPRRIELLLGAITSRRVLPWLHLARRSEGANENPLGIGSLHLRRSFQGCRRTLGSYVSQFLSQHCRVNAQLLRDLLAQLVTHDPTRHPLDVWQQVVDRLQLTFGAAHRKMTSRPVDQIVEILLRVLERLAVSILALAPDIQIRIEPLLQGKHLYAILDLELFFDQQAECPLRGFGPSRIRIKVDHDLLAEAREQLHLYLSKRRA